MHCGRWQLRWRLRRWLAAGRKTQHTAEFIYIYTPVAKTVYFRGRRIMYRCCCCCYGGGGGGGEGVKQPAAVVRWSRSRPLARSINSLARALFCCTHSRRHCPPSTPVHRCRRLHANCERNIPTKLPSFHPHQPPPPPPATTTTIFCFSAHVVIIISPRAVHPALYNCAFYVYFHLINCFYYTHTHTRAHILVLFRWSTRSFVGPGTFY